LAFTLVVASFMGAPSAMPATPPDAGIPPDGQMEFAVYRKGDQIGTHRLTFIEKGEKLEVHVDVELKVKVLFLTVYRYEHESTEVWNGDRLISFNSQTHQNGKDWQVSAHENADQLVVKTGEAQRELPEALYPTSYWNPEMMNQSVWFNTQYGSLIDVNVEPAGNDRVEALGRTVEASRYKVTGVIPETGKPVDMDLWYGQNGELMKLQFIAVKDGSIIEYQRVS
jgi:hypothetical protein